MVDRAVERIDQHIKTGQVADAKALADELKQLALVFYQEHRGTRREVLLPKWYNTVMGLAQSIGATGNIEQMGLLLCFAEKSFRWHQMPYIAPPDVDNLTRHLVLGAKKGRQVEAFDALITTQIVLLDQQAKRQSIQKTFSGQSFVEFSINTFVTSALYDVDHHFLSAYGRDEQRAFFLLQNQHRFDIQSPLLKTTPKTEERHRNHGALVGCLDSLSDEKKLELVRFCLL